MSTILVKSALNALKIKVFKKKNSLKKFNLVPQFLLSLVFLLISNLTNGLRLHQFLRTRTTDANKSLKTYANQTQWYDY